MVLWLLWSGSDSRRSEIQKAPTTYRGGGHWPLSSDYAKFLTVLRQLTGIEVLLINGHRSFQGIGKYYGYAFS